jgi:hypothetical protein
MVLRPVRDAARPGMYVGQVVATLEGDYRIQLSLVDPAGEQLLTRGFRVRVPNLEIEKPERDDAVLSALAERTGGAYYVGLPAAMGQRGIPGLSVVVSPQDQQTFLSGTPDREHEQRLMTWILAVLTTVLGLEWLIRRLNRLA